MASEFDRQASQATAALSHHFGARDEAGRPVEIRVRDKRKEWISLTGVVVHPMQVVDGLADIDSTHIVEEIEDVVEITIPRSQSFGDYRPVEGTRVELPGYPGALFVIQNTISERYASARVRATRRHATGIRQDIAERRQ